MKSARFFALLIGALCASNAHAWFFFFIPGSATRAIGDAVTGSKGNVCVKEGTQVGDVITSSNGNTAKVLSVSGNSSICRNPVTPIRAELEFTFSFSSKAGLDLPDDYSASTLTDLDRFNGWLLKSISKSAMNIGIQVSATPKKANVDIGQMANNIERNMQNNAALKDVASSQAETIEINGLQAVRFELAATIKGVFDRKIIYMYTIIEGTDEIVILNTFAPINTFAQRKSEFLKVAQSIAGLRAAEAPKPATQSESSATESAAVRLQRLQTLHERGLITNEELELRRKAILESL